MKTEKGLALQDILQGVHRFCHRLDFGDQSRIMLLERMAEIEWVGGKGVRSSGSGTYAPVFPRAECAERG